jgi:hypothetical protein
MRRVGRRRGAVGAQGGEDVRGGSAVGAQGVGEVGGWSWNDGGREDDDGVTGEAQGDS